MDTATQNELGVSYQLVDFIAPTTIEDFFSKLSYLGFQTIRVEESITQDPDESIYIYAYRGSDLYDFELSRVYGKKLYTVKWDGSPNRDYSVHTMHEFVGRMLTDGVIDLNGNKLD